MTARKRRLGKRGVVDTALDAEERRRAIGRLPLNQMIRLHAGLLFAGVATFVLMGAGQSLYGPALPVFARGLGLDLAQASGLVSAHWVGCFVGVVAMFLAGTRLPVRAPLALMAAGAAGVALGAGVWITLFGALVFGAGYGCATAIFNPRMLQAFGPRGPAMLSLLNATFGIGAIVAPLLFVAIGSNPALAFGGLAALCLAIWLAAGAADREAGTARPTSPQPFRPHWPILGFGLVVVGCEACLISLGPAALITTGETATAAAAWLSAFFVAFLLARVGLIFAAHRMKPFTLYTCAAGCTAITGFGAALLTPGPFFVLMGFFAGMFFPGYYVSASHRMGSNPRVAPTIVAAGLVGGIASPPLLAQVMEQAGTRGFFWILAGVLSMVTLAALLARPGMNRAP